MGPPNRFARSLRFKQFGQPAVNTLVTSDTISGRQRRENIGRDSRKSRKGQPYKKSATRFYAWCAIPWRGDPILLDGCALSGLHSQPHIRPKLKAVGLGWVDYRVLRRTHSSLMND